MNDTEEMYDEDTDIDLEEEEALKKEKMNKAKTKKAVAKKKELLKPCPFCGGKAKIEKNYFGWSMVVCDKCGVQTVSHSPDDTRSAVDEWNRRVA